MCALHSLLFREDPSILFINSINKINTPLRRLYWTPTPIATPNPRFCIIQTPAYTQVSNSNIFRKCQRGIPFPSKVIRRRENLAEITLIPLYIVYENANTVVS